MTIVGELGPSDFSERTRFHAPPPGLEPRQRVPKTRVLPLHHGGTAETYVFCQVFIMPYSSDAAYHGVSRGIVTNFWRIPMRDGSAANGIETIFKKFFAEN